MHDKARSWSGSAWLEPAEAIARFAGLDLWNPIAEASAIVGIGVITLGVAIWNGFPIIFYDTGAYLLEGLGWVFLPERSPVYSLFLKLGGAGISLWFVAILQAAMTAFIMVETIRVASPRTALAVAVGATAALAITTGLPWYAGQIEPDCFAPLAVLGLYVLAFGPPDRSLWRSCLLVGVSALSIGAHTSHFLLGVALLLALLGWRAGKALGWLAAWSRPRLAMPALSCALGLVLILASNFAFTGQVFVSRAGPAFVFARLLQDGIVMRLLDDTCPQSHYRLCAYKDVLPRTAVQWLWGRGSPFFKLNRFTGTNAESSRIIWDSLKRYPLLQIEDAAADAADQFVTFRTGDQIEAQEWVLSQPFEQLIPSQMRPYMAARQQHDRIDFRSINRVHVPVAWLSLVGIIAALGIAIRRRERDHALFLGFVFCGLVANAVICGALSNPHDRYQSRLIWLAPFALVLIAGDRFNRALRGWEESGT